MPYRIFRVFILIGILIGMALAINQTSSSMASVDGSEKIEARLIQRLLAEGKVDFFVRFSEQADLSAAYGMEWNERGRFVYNTLTETAQRSQARAKAYLNAQGITYNSFFAGNELAITAGSMDHALNLARLSEVEKLFIPPIYTIMPVEISSSTSSIKWAGELLSNHAENTVLLPDTVTWGIGNINADEFWSIFGVTGEDILVANIDTGVYYQHSALFDTYACRDSADHANCWYDPDNLVDYPVDNVGHGTHTMGTMIGDDPAGVFQIGMAPNAKWITCQGCDTTGCETVDLAACGDWILAPGGNPDNRPQVVNNSWGSADDESGDVTWYLSRVQAWRAAGIFPAFSAGNNGPNCDTLGVPGSYQESFASAAHDIYGEPYTIGSRGPSSFGDEPFTKPNISGPGVDIYSSCIGSPTYFCRKSGTSMASPHLAGAVALLWSCNPSLIGQISTTFELMQNTARNTPSGNCGLPVDGEGNYTYGYGFLDVLEAGYYVCEGALTGILQGQVYDLHGIPLVNATITITSDMKSNFQTLTDSSGVYSIRLPVGVYSVNAFLNGYLDSTVDDVNVLFTETTSQDFNLSYIGLWTEQPSNTCTNLTRFDAEFFPETELVYILGGRYAYRLDADTTVDTTVGRIYVYDPKTGSCSDTGSVMPIPVSNYTISLINQNGKDVLCTFGGRMANAAQTLAVQCYDPIQNIAEQVASLPSDPYSYATVGAQVVYDNQVYLFGGIEFDTGTPETNLLHTFRYDPQTHSFIRLGDLNQARGYIMAAVVDGRIYAFGGEVYDGNNLSAQITTEVMVDPQDAGTWSDAAVTDLPIAAGESQAFGFDSDSGHQLSGRVAISALPQYPGSSYEVITYDVSSNSYYLYTPNFNIPRRNHAGVFVPIETADTGDGLPGLWVLGGFCTGDSCGGDLQPYGAPEFLPIYSIQKMYIPLINK